MSILYCPKTECPICFTDPFESDLSLKTHKWYGHDVLCGQDLKIHGICQACFPIANADINILKCYFCRAPYLNGQITEFSLNKEGLLISKKLLSSAAYLREEEEPLPPLVKTLRAIIISAQISLFVCGSLVVTSYLLNQNRLFLIAAKTIHFVGLSTLLCGGTVIVLIERSRKQDELLEDDEPLFL